MISVNPVINCCVGLSFSDVRDVRHVCSDLSVCAIPQTWKSF